MNRVSDFSPFVPRPIAPPGSKGVDSLPTTTWFDGRSDDGGMRISAGMNVASRGLSVDQHAARVLEHLCIDSDERA